MYYLVLHLVGQNGQVLEVYNSEGEKIRAEFTTRWDAEMARRLVVKFNSHSAWVNCSIEKD
jgi:hypothetical protein